MKTAYPGYEANKKTTIIAFDVSKDYYNILGITAGTIGHLNSAYLKQSRRWAPCTFDGITEFLDLLKQAHATLSNPVSKAAYDAARIQRIASEPDLLPKIQAFSADPELNRLFPWYDNVEEWELSRAAEDYDDGYSSSSTVSSIETRNYGIRGQSSLYKIRRTVKPQPAVTTEDLTPLPAEEAHSPDPIKDYVLFHWPPRKPARECVFADYFYDDLTDKPIIADLRRHHKQAQAAWRAAQSWVARPAWNCDTCKHKPEMYKVIEARSWKDHLEQARTLRREEKTRRKEERRLLRRHERDARSRER
ncbi:uncharacterized protein AB675_944 [Cyphellophora attinorum]|uniref:J domain-containing protein n=1 Tax=Cyphellophora attinorum TaxID=1664694 RepID=A0A0N0NSK4_9EURO|nr:uncharacterized protein AB675_944 [Phialophora attinorum]KPI46089.1 hypothetical protein AB675_944 [Phialophora attinorum]